MRRIITKACTIHQLRPETNPVQVYAHPFKFGIFFFTVLKTPPWNQTRHSFNEKGKPLCFSDEINKPHVDFSGRSIQDLLLELSHVSPETIRPFWRRILNFSSHDFHHILLAFKDCSNPDVVTLLWKLFNSVDGYKDNVAQSCEIMGSMVIQVGLLNEAESLLRTMGTRGVALSSQEILCSKIIGGYVIARDLEKAVSMYNWMRSRGFVPSQPCFQLLINRLIEMKKPQLALKIYKDMVEVGVELDYEDMTMFELVTKLLCKEGKVQEARNLVRKLTALGFDSSCIVLDTIADGYCEKKDFDDLLNFLNERRCAPAASICNKIISYQCRNFGVEQAYSVMVELEQLGFSPDEITFGFFISWSCRDGKLKDAFIYLSELLSRGLKPELYSYNALISGVFKEGMCKHASDILSEMLERGVMPDLSTFRILLAGYCKFRQFDEAKAIVREMVSRNLAQLSSWEDPLSKAFDILGFKPSAVKVKRDNDAGHWKAEFFDALGNGLYLETDLDEYEKIVTRVLEDAFVFYSNSHLFAQCDHGNVKAALKVKDHLIYRGEKFSSPAYSALVKALCASHSHVTKAVDILEEIPELVHQLDQETLNCLLRVISKKRALHLGRIILDGMFQRDFFIENDAYTAFIMALCKNGRLKELNECWGLARKSKWLPGLKDCKALVECLCQKKMLEEVLDLLERMVRTSFHPTFEISTIFLEVLCSTGHTSTGLKFAEEILRVRLVLNNMAYMHLIRGFCKEKKFQEALGILDTMLRKDMTPCLDVYSQLVHHLCKSCRLQRCMILKKAMLEKEPTAWICVYGSLISGLCKVGKIKQATTEFQEMISKGMSPDIDTYNVMIQGHCQDDNSRKIGELLGVMIRINSRISLSSFRSLVSLMCKHNKVSHVLSLKEFMLRESKSPLVVYNILIFWCSKIRNNSLVKLILEEMNLKGLILDEVTYNFLVFGYYKCGDVSKALEALETMICKDLQPSKRSLTTIIRHFCYDGNLDKALELSRLMESRGWVHGSVVLHSIVEGFLSHGRLLDAINFLYRMKEKSLILNSVSYDIMIKQFCWYGKLDVAVDLLNIALKKGDFLNPTCYDYIIQAFCVCNAVDEALNFHAEMLVRNFKPSIKSWDMLNNKLCQKGWTAESERLLDSMVQLGQTPTQNMYKYAIDRYCSENNLKKASDLLQKMQQNGHVPDFNTQWSLISNLSNIKNKNRTESGGFLSKLLSLSGFNQKIDAKTKVG